jgi:serine/threonine-protein kinase
MVTFAGGVKVVDFGIASAMGASHQTRPGIVRGKASYMSPEQCLGTRVDLRSDVFALGVVLYELTTGRRCILGDSDFDRMVAAVRGEYVAPSLHDPMFPRELEAVIARALAIDPEQRYPSAAAMVEALERVAQRAGWACNAASIATFVSEMFVERDGAVVEVGEDDVVEVALAAGAATPAAGPARTRVVRRSLAGLQSLDAADDAVDEDLPTRGRRSLARVRLAA